MLFYLNYFLFLSTKYNIAGIYIRIINTFITNQPINATAKLHQSSSFNARVISHAIVVDDVKNIGTNLDCIVCINASFNPNHFLPKYQSINNIALFTHTHITHNNHNWAGKLNGNPSSRRAIMIRKLMLI